MIPGGRLRLLRRALRRMRKTTMRRMGLGSPWTRRWRECDGYLPAISLLYLGGLGLNGAAEAGEMLNKLVEGALDCQVGQDADDR